MEVYLELRCCEDVILNELKHREVTQKDIAQTYRLALRSSEDIDWGKINKAIVKRWSLSGLKRIKETAWSGKCFEENGGKIKDGT